MTDEIRRGWVTELEAGDEVMIRRHTSPERLVLARVVATGAGEVRVRPVTEGGVATKEVFDATGRRPGQRRDPACALGAGALPERATLERATPERHAESQRLELAHQIIARAPQALPRLDWSSLLEVLAILERSDLDGETQKPCPDPATCEPRQLDWVSTAGSPEPEAWS